MDMRKLKTLVDLVSESNISELEITEAEGKVRIVKAGYGVPTTMMMQPAGQMMMAPQQQHAAPAGEPAPAAAPAVEVGAAIKEGDLICIVEAMKIMNEIECDMTGTVSKILVENGQAVEYGQPLFIVE